MTHELKTIFESYALANKQGFKTVLATVVDLDGSSYRKPGVRMLIWENGKMKGAVSGGCVEKEVVRQAKNVFKTGDALMMTYDGRYRLGCEGVLYILLEPFNPTPALISAFNKALELRQPIKIDSFYKKQEGALNEGGSNIIFEDGSFYSFLNINHINSGSLSFNQTLPPCLKLLIIGAEHDAVALCLQGSLIGWEVTVVSSIADPKSINDFPGAKEVLAIAPQDITSAPIDNQTAVVLMTHNYAKDLHFLLALKEIKPLYLGLLGAKERKEKLLSQFLETTPEADFEFLGIIRGPAGLYIGAITPQEIAVSIIAEILTVQRKIDFEFSMNKMESLHS